MKNIYDYEKKALKEYSMKMGIICITLKLIKII